MPTTVLFNNPKTLIYGAQSHGGNAPAVCSKSNLANLERYQRECGLIGYQSLPALATLTFQHQQANREADGATCWWRWVILNS